MSIAFVHRSIAICVSVFCTIRLLAYPKVPVLAELVPTCLLCPVAFNELVWYSTAMRHTQDSVQILNGSTVQRDIIGLSRESEQL